MKRRWLLCGVAILPAMPAGAQQAAKATETVRVQGSRPAVQNLADRQVYTTDRDLQSTTGTAIDVLRNIPSVEIDVDGGVRLRGDSNVTILIDGKRSALLAGSDALEQIPAENIERIEVVTNPSAEFKAEGSGGIINIITKKGTGGATAMSARANIGDYGRANASASGSTSVGNLKLSGGLAFRRDGRARTGESERRSSQQRQITSQAGHREMAMAMGRAETTFADKNVVAVELSGRSMLRWFRDSERNTTQTGDTFTRSGPGTMTRSMAEASLKYTRLFSREGEELTLEFQRGTDWGTYRAHYTNAAPGQTDSYDRWDNKEKETEMSLRADYVRPFETGAKLKAGAVSEMERNWYSNFGEHFDAPVPGWTINPNYTSLYVVNQTVHAGYATYEDKFGRLGALAGLRLERTSVVADQRTMGSRLKHTYLDLFPSLHLTYELADGQQLRASYSRRINRPDDHDLNPSLDYRDAFNVFSGNPDLKPEKTDSIELGYKYAADSFDTLLTGFYRQTRDGITDVSRVIAGNVLLTTKENLAKSLRTGFELAVNGDISDSLEFQLNGSAYYSEINPGATSLGAFRSGLAWSGKASLDYAPTPDDQFQLSANYTAKRFSAQGYTLPGYYANFAYRHNFSKVLSGVLTVSNLFDSNKNKTVLTTGVQEVSIRRQPGRIIFVGLTYSLGKADQDEEMEQPANGDD